MFVMMVGFPLGAALVNSIFDIVEELNIWMPFPQNPDLPHHLQCNALIGNPNEVGSYLAVATLAALAGAIADVARRKSFVLAALLLGAGVIASQTLTAFVALIAGAFVLFGVVETGPGGGCDCAGRGRIFARCATRDDHGAFDSGARLQPARQRQTDAFISALMVTVR
jgi:hypothetical protein